MYKRKTQDEYEVQGHYGQGWECVFTAETYKEARDIRRDYNQNEPQYEHRIIKKRIPLEVQV